MSTDLPLASPTTVSCKQMVSIAVSDHVGQHPPCPASCGIAIRQAMAAATLEESVINRFIGNKAPYAYANLRMRASRRLGKPASASIDHFNHITKTRATFDAYDRPLKNSWMTAKK